MWGKNPAAVRLFRAVRNVQWGFPRLGAQRLPGSGAGTSAPGEETAPTPVFNYLGVPARPLHRRGGAGKSAGGKRASLRTLLSEKLKESPLKNQTCPSRWKSDNPPGRCDS